MENTLESKLLHRVILILQIFYIMSFLLFIHRTNIYGQFVICTLLNTVSFVLSLYNLKSKNNGKLLLLFISILQILFTIFVYILPEAGKPALIKLW